LCRERKTNSRNQSGRAKHCRTPQQKQTETKAAEQNTAALHSKNKQKPKRQSKTLPHSTAKTNRNQSGRAKHCRTPKKGRNRTKPQAAYHSRVRPTPAACAAA